MQISSTNQQTLVSSGNSSARNLHSAQVVASLHSSSKENVGLAVDGCGVLVDGALVGGGVGAVVAGVSFFLGAADGAAVVVASFCFEGAWVGESVFTGGALEGASVATSFVVGLVVVSCVSALGLLLGGLVAASLATVGATVGFSLGTGEGLFSLAVGSSSSNLRVAETCIWCGSYPFSFCVMEASTTEAPKSNQTAGSNAER